MAASSSVQVNKRYIPKVKGEPFYDWVEPGLHMIRYGAILCRVKKGDVVVGTVLNEGWILDNYKLEKQMTMENK